MFSILMATYNGERFIREQLDSLFAQSYKDFTLYISDDASSDDTWAIINEYADRYPNIKATQNPKNSGSAKFNFLDLLVSVKDDYIMLCDQDDLWLPDKIERTFKKMREMEAAYGKDTPILVHTDLRVVDEDLKTVNPSFITAMNCDPGRTKLNQVLVQNTLTGCTAMYNRALADKLIKKPAYCVMHDWWIKLIASAFGKIGFLNEATILYRQHGANEVGAKNVRTLKYTISRLQNCSSIKEKIVITYPQAKSFLEIYEEDLDAEQAKMVRKYVRIPKSNKIKRLMTVFELKSFKFGLVRNIAYLLFV